jgi:amylosucrase
VTPGVNGVFAFQRVAPTGVILCLFNFTEGWLQVPEAWAREQGITLMEDALSEYPVQSHGGQIVLPPYARVWLT